MHLIDLINHPSIDTLKFLGSIIVPTVVFSLLVLLAWKLRSKKVVTVKRARMIVTDRLTLSLHTRALEELQSQADWLTQEVTQYPIEVVFGDIRRVFANRSDIDKLIGELGTSISDFKHTG